MTIIRDINGNRLTKTLQHARNHAANITGARQDSTGLWMIDYTDAKETPYCAFIRPETPAERAHVAVARRLTGN